MPRHFDAVQGDLNGFQLLILEIFVCFQNISEVGKYFIEQLLFWHIALKFLEFYFCTIFWQRCKSKSNRIYKFCFNRFLSAVSERVSLKATYTTMNNYSDVSSPSFHWFDDRIQIILWRLSPSMGSCCDLPAAVTEDVEVSWWDRKNAAKLVSL